MDLLVRVGLEAPRPPSAVRPKAGGFPYLAEALRLAGVGFVWYDVDLRARTCTYYGADGDDYTECHAGVGI
ncbi:hypothetical protein [Streptomyces sp. NPDC048357]|uniref:hypothetical protein n=1 Tax=Streptomyces sp. NPDC048357 TaxID=3154719 RepID=UPI003419C28F